jgi:hypothetical protein
MDSRQRRPDLESGVRTGLIAAGLALLAAAVLLSGGGRAESATVAHTCSATDRQFIKAAQLNMLALGLWGEQYREGAVTATEVVAEARRAAKRVSKLEPRDPSLRKTQLLVAGMITEYGRAMQAKAKEKNAGPHMYRAYGLANFARDVLVDAAPDLKKHGCDVSSLL